MSLKKVEIDINNNEDIKNNIKIEGHNEENGINCCYGHLCLLQNEKEGDDDNIDKKVVDSKSQMITCDIKLCVKKYHHVCQMRFCHETEDKKNLLKINSKCCLVHTNKVDDTE